MGVSHDDLDSVSAVRQLAVARHLPAFLLARVGNEHPALARSVQLFVDAANSAGLDISVVDYLEGQHGFDVVDDTERSRELVLDTVAFFRGHLLESHQPGSSTVG